MPSLYSMPFPSATNVMHAMLNDIAPVVLRPPQDFTPPLLVIRRVGGRPNLEGDTDYPLILVSAYGNTYTEAEELMGQVTVRVLSSPLTMVNGVLIDEATLYVGEMEVPDVYPDDRRITETFQLGWRRQFLPAGA